MLGSSLAGVGIGLFISVHLTLAGERKRVLDIHDALDATTSHRRGLASDAPAMTEGRNQTEVIWESRTQDWRRTCASDGKARAGRAPAAMTFFESNVVQPTMYGIFGARTLGEVQEDRKASRFRPGAHKSPLDECYRMQGGSEPDLQPPEPEREKGTLSKSGCLMAIGFSVFEPPGQAEHS